LTKIQNNRKCSSTCQKKFPQYHTVQCIFTTVDYCMYSRNRGSARSLVPATVPLEINQPQAASQLATMASVRRKRTARPAASPSGPQPNRSRDASSDINEDTLGLVMEFLGLRELFRMAFTCKSLRSKVTTRLVIRSEVMHGGFAATTVNALFGHRRSEQSMPRPY
jgi:hypothetical protein